MRKVRVAIFMYILFGFCVHLVWGIIYANRIVLLEDRLFDTLICVNNIGQHNFNYVVIPQKDFEL